MVLENIVARPTTWWALKDISGMPLLRGNRQLVSSLTWRKPMRQPGNMASSETFTGLASEADCLFLFQNISGTGESESELGQHPLMNSTQRKVFQLAVSWLWHVLDWRLTSCPCVLPRTSSKHSLLVDLAICFWGRSLDTIKIHLQQAVNAIQEWATRNGFRFAAHKCKVVHFTAPRFRAQKPPLWGLETHFCRWKSSRSSLGCGGTRTSHLRSTSVCWRHSARRLSTSSEWWLTWNGEGTETHSWCCAVPLFVPSLTMVALCMAQHQTPTYDNWTAFITLDWD